MLWCYHQPANSFSWALDLSIFFRVPLGLLVATLTCLFFCQSLTFPAWLNCILPINIISLWDLQKNLNISKTKPWIITLRFSWTFVYFVQIFLTNSGIFQERVCVFIFRSCDTLTSIHSSNHVTHFTEIGVDTFPWHIIMTFMLDFFCKAFYCKTRWIQRGWKLLHLTVQTFYSTSGTGPDFYSSWWHWTNFLWNFLGLVNISTKMYIEYNYLQHY